MTQPNGDTPGADATVTPPTTAGNQPQEKMVTISEAEIERLKAHQSSADTEANRLRDIIKKNGFSPDSGQPVTPPTPATDAGKNGSDEDLKAERELIKLAASPEYRDVIDSDPTFRDVLINNPLSLLPVYAKNAIDADDAVGLVKKELNRRLEAKKASATPPAEPPKAPPTPASNPSNTPSPAYDEALKNGNLSEAIRLKRFGK